MDEHEQSLSREILADAERRAGRATQRAEREAQNVLDDAAKQARAQRDEVLGAAEGRIEHERAVSGGRVEQEVIALNLGVRHQRVERVRAEAVRLLGELANGPQHYDALKALALLAVEAMSAERVSLVLRAEDRAKWGERLAAEVLATAEVAGRHVEVQVADEDLTASGGLVVVGEGGHEVADQTFEARLERLWDDIGDRTAAMLPDLPEAAE